MIILICGMVRIRMRNGARGSEVAGFDEGSDEGGWKV